MRRFIMLLFSVLIVGIIALFVGRNFLIKYILEDRMSQINQAEVKIGSVQSNLFDKYIVLNDIRVESQKNKGTDFIRVQQLKSYYDLQYNEKKVHLRDAELIGFEFVLPEDEEDLAKLKEERAVEVVNRNIDPMEFLKEREKETLAEENQVANIQDLINSFKKEKFSFDLDEIKDKIDSLKEKIKTIQKATESPMSVDKVLGNYLTGMYQDEIYDLLVKYRKVVREVEERVRKDMERKDEIWEVQVHRATISFDLYHTRFNGEIKNFNSRLSKNLDSIPFKLFGEKNDTIGMIKGDINLLRLELKAVLDIPELDLTSIPEFQKYLSEGSASLKQDIYSDKYDIALDGVLLAKKLRLPNNPIMEKLKDVQVQYHYDSRDRQLYLRSDILKNAIDE